MKQIENVDFGGVPKFRNFYASRHPLQSVDLFSKGFRAQLRKCIELLGQAIALARCFRKVLKQIENVDFGGVQKFQIFHPSRHPLESAGLSSTGFDAPLRKCVALLGRLLRSKDDFERS